MNHLITETSGWGFVAICDASRTFPTVASSVRWVTSCGYTPSAMITATSGAITPSSPRVRSRDSAAEFSGLCIVRW